MDITHCLQQPAQKDADGIVKSGGLRELIPYHIYIYIFEEGCY